MTVGQEHNRRDQDQGQREQPAAALHDHGQLQTGGGKADQGAAQQPGELAPSGERDRHERFHREHGGSRVEVAGRGREAPLDHQGLDVVGRGQPDQQHDRQHPNSERERQQRDHRPVGRPWQGRHRGQNQQVEKCPVAAEERIPRRPRPADRQVRPGNVQGERHERHGCGPWQAQSAPTARDHDRGEQTEQDKRAPVPGVGVKAAVVYGPEDHQRDHDEASDQPDNPVDRAAARAGHPADRLLDCAGDSHRRRQRAAAGSAANRL
jgi:hypothetical protein